MVNRAWAACVSAEALAPSLGQIEHPDVLDVRNRLVGLEFLQLGNLLLDADEVVSYD